MVTDSGLIDNTVEIITPENIAFRYQLAGPMRRMAAFFVDMVVKAAIFVGLIVAVGSTLGVAGLENFGLLVMGIGLLGVDWLYGAGLETFWNGQTIGKRALGIRVLSVDGQPITAAQALARNVFRAADLQPFGLSLVGLVATLLSGRFQRLGDLASGTIVVIEERPWFRGVLRMSDPEALRLVARIPANFRVSNSLGRALAAYVERRLYFSWPRRLEIARHVASPLCQRLGLPPETNPDQLLCAMYQRAFIAEGEAERGRRLGGGRQVASALVPLEISRPARRPAMAASVSAGIAAGPSALAERGPAASDFGADSEFSQRTDTSAPRRNEP